MFQKSNSALIIGNSYVKYATIPSIKQRIDHNQEVNRLI